MTHAPHWRSGVGSALRLTQPALIAFAPALAGFCALARSPLGPRRRPRTRKPPDPFAALKAKFARPTFVPQPADNPPTPAKIALGRRLFADKQLSATGTIACASCHDARLSFTDGESKGKGVTGKPLERHTPSLWNVAFAPLLFWDGRAASLEAQVRFPVEHPDEMGSSLESAALRLATDDSYAARLRRGLSRRSVRVGIATSPRRWRPTSAR